MKKGTFIKLILSEMLRILFIFFPIAILLFLDYNKIFLTSFYIIVLAFYIMILIYLIRKMVNKLKLVGILKKVLFLIVIISLLSLSGLTIIRIVDIFWLIHPLLQKVIFWIVCLGAYVASVSILIVKIHRIINIKETGIIKKVNKYNDEILKYPDEGIFYDNSGCGIITVTLNMILIMLMIVLGVFLHQSKIFQGCNTLEFPVEPISVCSFIATFAIFLCSIFHLVSFITEYKYRITIVFELLVMINLLFNLILFLNKEFYLIIFVFQFLSFLFYVFSLVVNQIYKSKYLIFNIGINDDGKLQGIDSTKLLDFLKCKKTSIFKCLIGNREATDLFIESAANLNAKMIRCGKIFQERKEFYDYVLILDGCNYESADEICVDIKNKLKEYFNYKYGFIFGRKYIIELVKKMKRYYFSFRILKKIGESELIRDCSRINVIVRNYQGYYDNKEWTKKICICASRLQLNVTFVSGEKVEEPNDSFYIESIKI